MSTSELLPASEQADAALYRTGSDTLDVWLDSGLSWAAALNGEASDLVLEGSDQHRGWFQSSLLTAAALTGRAPFKTVLTHGFVLDESGRKMSKSEGNTLDPLDVVNQYSADVLRLWAVAGNYHQDLRVGDASLLQAQDSYLKFRRTLRFMLANLFDFDATSQPALLPEDQAALDQLAELRSQVQAAYESCDFNEALRLLQNYAAQNLSRDWFGTETTGLKARLYLCYEGAADSSDRRSGQSALYQACQTLTALLEPMLPHLAQEVRNHQR
jgi:isoleucyl-tRNA synthetase